MSILLTQNCLPHCLANDESTQARSVDNQRAFEHRVLNEVAVGMPVKDAIARLSTMRLDCSRGNPADCSRIRQSLMPYSCIERVRVSWTDQTQGVSNIEIPKIACAGF